MGIAYSTGVIRDFAGPYYVSEDNLAFGKTTRYYQLEPQNVKGKIVGNFSKINSFHRNGVGSSSTRGIRRVQETYAQYLLVSFFLFYVEAWRNKYFC